MRRILVVDDDRSICRALQIGLSSKKVEVDIADNGESGVELGIRNRYEVIIADMILPEVDGLEVIRRIKTHFPDIVSILMTGSPEASVLTQSIRYGVNAYLEKPLRMETIREAISRGLEERTLKRKSVLTPGSVDHETIKQKRSENKPKSLCGKGGGLAEA
jgi:DNA-binding NtrC family response regulator